MADFAKWLGLNGGDDETGGPRTTTQPGTTSTLPGTTSTPPRKTSSWPDKTSPPSFLYYSSSLDLDPERNLVKTDSLDEILALLAGSEGRIWARHERSGMATPTPSLASTKGFSRPPPPMRRVRAPPTSTWWCHVDHVDGETMDKLREVVALHPLTVEDILVGEEREKVEFFKEYYLVSFARAATPRPKAGRHAGAVPVGQDAAGFRDDAHQVARGPNLYLVVLKDGLISFDPGDADDDDNEASPFQDIFKLVLSRIEKLRLGLGTTVSDRVTVSSDWIAYAIMDTVVDHFYPLMSRLEDEVERLEDQILLAHDVGETETETNGAAAATSARGGWFGRERRTTGGSRPRRRVKEFNRPLPDLPRAAAQRRQPAVAQESVETTTLRRLGQARQMALVLNRLLATKADVLRGLVKRGGGAGGDHSGGVALYLSDIGDHVATMLEALNHYDTILSSLAPTYTSSLRTGLMAMKIKTEMTMMRFGMVGAVVLPIQFVTNIMSTNIHIPWFKTTDPNLHAFAVLVALVVSIAAILVTIFIRATRSIGGGRGTKRAGRVQAQESRGGIYDERRARPRSRSRSRP